nr:HAMP domain-containing histidine kinase [Verrucomicrobiota bacterium]
MPAVLSPGPRLTLLLLVGTALVVLAGGVQVARQEEKIRVDRDRESVRRFAGDLQAELQRLERLYENHLTRITRTAPRNDPFETRRIAERIVGVRQFSVLRAGGQSRADDHIRIEPASGQRIPMPMFSVPRAGLVGEPVLVPETTLLNAGYGEWDWIDEPGKPLMFWMNHARSEAVVLLIDRSEVRAAIQRWLEGWAPKVFEPVRVAGGPDELRNESGSILMRAGEPARDRPDLLLPVRSRFGSWDLASWDRRETRIRYDPVAMTASAAIAVFLALLGVAVFVQQKRALQLAAQRVSFVNRVSHELRSPLTNILLNVDLAADAVHDDKSDTGRRLALVQEEARRLGRLIDNVLTFSRREQGAPLRLEAHACIPNNVIGAVVEQFASSLARGAIELRRTGRADTACL